MKPMLASPVDLKMLHYPVIASPKFDGVRGIVYENMLLSRSLKKIPNKFVQKTLAVPELDGIDGELIVGEPTSKSCYRDTSSAVMGHEGEPHFSFYVFDIVHKLDMPWQARYDILARRVAQLRGPLFTHVVLTAHRRLFNEAALLQYEEEVIAEGHEGLILRDPNAPYKYGRSTTKEGWLLKMKRFVDGEAEVLGIEEEMFNGNEAQTSELGRTKRSTAKAGLVGKGTMGALVVKDMASNVKFRIGTGFDAEDRKREWKPGTIVKYKHFPVGAKDAPRHPVYLGIRERIDL